MTSPVRREILWLAWDEELSVGAIGAHFGLSAPTLSSHLTALRGARLVSMRVDGNFRRYRSNREALRALVPLMASSDERWIAVEGLPDVLPVTPVRLSGGRDVSPRDRGKAGPD